jgi:hypothetical protein
MTLASVPSNQFESHPSKKGTPRFNQSTTRSNARFTESGLDLCVQVKD